MKSPLMSCVVSTSQKVRCDHLLKSPTQFAPNRERLAPLC